MVVSALKVSSDKIAKEKGTTVAVPMTVYPG
jgi:hypothetical protein